MRDNLNSSTFGRSIPWENPTLRAEKQGMKVYTLTAQGLWDCRKPRQPGHCYKGEGKVRFQRHLEFLFSLCDLFPNKIQSTDHLGGGKSQEKSCLVVFKILITLICHNILAIKTFPTVSSVP